MSKPTVLIIKLGSTYRELISRWGDFDKLIINSVPDLSVKWKSQKIENVVPETIEKYQGIIFTGAHDSLLTPYPFLKGAERLIDYIIDLRIFTLGICFGHQLINKLLGGEVCRNPLGPEIGVSTIQLTLSGLVDPIFNGYGHSKIQVYSSHFDIVTSISDNTECLAWNEQSEFQATRYDSFIYTTQFHPEYNKNVMAYYINKNFAVLKNEHYRNPLNIPKPSDILQNNKQIRNSSKILGNFLSLIIQANLKA
ncbi:MAG TPA: hypothetical protein DHW42_04330 [Candidatus Marinimicrobia bacterium]|nr:hypothetical protein [Candidatus Neomarinimicrobiota bacterium]